MKQIIIFCSNLLDSINAIDVGVVAQSYCDQFIIQLLPYLPEPVIQSLKEVILLTVKYTPQLMKDMIYVLSSIMSPTVIVKQIAFTGVIQTTLLTSHFVRQLIDSIKSVIFEKVSVI